MKAEDNTLQDYLMAMQAFASMYVKYARFRTDAT